MRPGDVIHIGRFALPFTWLVVAGAIFVGTLALRLFRRIADDDRRAFGDLLWNGFTGFLLAWKLTPLVVRFRDVAADPRALLFLPGGAVGVGIGVVVGVAVVVVSARRRRLDLRKLVPSALRFALVAGSAAGVLLAVGFLLAPAAGGVGTSVGSLAPSFSGPTLSEETFALAESDGRIRVVNFWASWCAPCRVEKPDLIRFAAAYPDDVLVVGVNLTSGESSVESVRGFVEEFHIPFPIVLDETGRLASLYEVRSVPSTYVIDPDGVIMAKRTGAGSFAWLLGATGLR